MNLYMHLYMNLYIYGYRFTHKILLLSGYLTLTPTFEKLRKWKKDKKQIMLESLQFDTQ